MCISSTPALFHLGRLSLRLAGNTCLPVLPQKPSVIPFLLMRPCFKSIQREFSREMPSASAFILPTRYADMKLGSWHENVALT